MRNDFLNYSKPNFYYFKFLIAYNWSNISSINVSKFESVATKELNWRGMVIFLSETIESSVQLPFLNSERIHNWNASPSTSPPPLPPPLSRFRGSFCLSLQQPAILHHIFHELVTRPDLRRAVSARFPCKRIWRAVARAFPMRSAHKDNKHVGAPCLLFLKSSKRKS